MGGRPLPQEHLLQVEDASVAIFQDTHYCIIPADRATPAAVKTVVGMVELLGAKPLFLSAVEHDSYSSAAALLPRILSAAFISSVSAGASWREIARLAGAEFRDVSRFASDDPKDNATACLANTDTVVHWIDQMIDQLATYRDHVKEGDDGLVKVFTKAHEERSKWVAETVVEEYRPEIPTIGETMGGMFFGRRLVSRFRRATGANAPPKGSDRK